MMCASIVDVYKKLEIGERKNRRKPHEIFHNPIELDHKINYNMPGHTASLCVLLYTTIYLKKNKNINKKKQKRGQSPKQYKNVYLVQMRTLTC